MLLPALMKFDHGTTPFHTLQLRYLSVLAQHMLFDPLPLHHSAGHLQSGSVILHAHMHV